MIRHPQGVRPSGQDGISPDTQLRSAIVNAMPEGKIWTADELLAMTPNERHAIVEAGFVDDIDQVPPELLERARADIRAHIADNESHAPTEQ